MIHTIEWWDKIHLEFKTSPYQYGPTPYERSQWTNADWIMFGESPVEVLDAGNDWEKVAQHVAAKDFHYAVALARWNAWKVEKA